MSNAKPAITNPIPAETIDSYQELILSLAGDMAAIQNRERLDKLLKGPLSSAIGFKYSTVFVLNDDGREIVNFFENFENTSDRFQERIFVKKIPFDRKANGINSPQQFFDFDDLFQKGDVGAYLTNSDIAENYLPFTFRLAKGGDVIGVWLILSDKVDKAQQIPAALCQVIAGNLTFAILNIKAQEEIEKLKKEREKYKEQLEEETSYLKEEIQTTQNYGDIIGESPAIKRTFKLVSQVAMSDSTVLILGETGTGKELIARAIHNNSPRKNKLMVKVNCAALPPSLIESELFGHERGSFTGATEQRLGKFELANNSTLFLDEIGEMPIDLQVKLLRVLQEKEIERVGGSKTIKVDVRIVAATNRDLEKEVAERRFRSDLYYRLNIFPVSLPPLRERKEDIPLLAAYFVRRFAKKAGRQITTFSNNAMQHMLQYNWPGNIRELEHIIERCVLLSSGDAIKFADLPLSKRTFVNPEPVETLLKTIDENERDHILRILKFCGGKLAGNGGAAQILGVPAGTLYSKMKRLGIKREHSI